MKWQTKEMDTYLKEKEYIDTAIIPLVPISWQNEIKSTVAMGEFISIICSELERQFQGRCILFPSFSYIKNEEERSRNTRLMSWIEELKKGDIKYIFLLTSDHKWSTVEDVKDMLVWLPVIPLEHVEDKYKQTMIEDQIKQLIPMLTNKWQSFL